MYAYVSTKFSISKVFYFHCAYTYIFPLVSSKKKNRYERMTRGRRREHYQWNMDIWGVEGVAAEAELLSAMVAFLERVGLGPEDVGIKVRV